MTDLCWEKIYELIMGEKKCTNSLVGYFCFKLKPIIGNYVNKKLLINFIKENYINPC